jgi:pyridoxal 5'-phosphate synthase pdxS subunit
LGLGSNNFSFFFPVLTPADYSHHIDKHPFKIPFVCGARNLGEALRRIEEGAAMIRTKGEAGTGLKANFVKTGQLFAQECFYSVSVLLLPGDVAEAVRHARHINSEIKRAQTMDTTELYSYAKELQVSFQLLKKTAELGRLPVVNFAAGGLGKYCCVV